MEVLKKPLVIVFVLFLGFYLLREPDDLARFSQTAGLAVWDMVSTLFEAIITFLNTLLG